MNKFFSHLLTFNILVLFGIDSFAKGQPTEWQMGFQEAASPLMAELAGLHDFVSGLCFYNHFCLLLAYVCVKFS